ncbi:MAG: glycoside hydrolase family 5 protein [Acholeplasmataceae bacterium]
MTQSFVHTKDGQLYDHLGNPLLLEGVGLNGWLLPEGYMFNSIKTINRPRGFYAWTEKLLGKKASIEFWASFRKHFITENDIITIKNLGFNSVRLPFDYEIIFEPSDTEAILNIKPEGLQWIDALIAWCRKQELYVILDLHGAPGGQTGANIDNSLRDLPELFTNRLYQKQSIYIWSFLAKRYKDEPWVAAYDLLNEPLPEWFSKHYHQLVPLYQEMIEAIRLVDKNHMISIEGVHWSTDFSIFNESLDDQVLLQFHKYWSPFDLEAVKPYVDLSQRWRVPLYMGEGGEHYPLWYSSAFKLYHQLDISWCFWSYKKIENTNSICSFKEPPLWQRCLNLDPTLTKDDIVETLDLFLNNIKIKECLVHQSVVNHLFLKDDFEMFGIGFDFDLNQLAHVDQRVKYPKFRASEKVLCVTEEGNEMTPDFSIGKRPDINTPFPYLLMEPKKSYRYLFHTSELEKEILITIEHKDLLDVEILVDRMLITTYNVLENQIEFKVVLKKGVHHISLSTNKIALLKKIIFH